VSTRLNENNIFGSINNEGVNNLEYILFSAKEGTVFISPNNASRASAIVIDNGGTTITNDTSTGGINVGDSTSVTGTINMSSKGTNLKKGEYSENNRATKIYTYQETVLVESIPKEVLAEVAGKLGQNIGGGMDGGMPITTDISAGPLPHSHTIAMFKHVHRIEPTYLYRLPEPLAMVLGAMKQLKEFFIT
jgi:hypothetical protein